ncbi:MAG: ComEC/Rec2 family competence protein [bacterium]
MTKLRIVLAFISVIALRWYTYPSPLPPTWTSESRVRFTATILEQPEQTDSQTIIRKSIWYIPVKGYAEIIPGSRVAFVGKVEPKVLGGKVVRIIMKDPTFEVVRAREATLLKMVEWIMITLGEWREKWVSILEKTLPEPMSSLAAGILLGVKGQMPTEFYQQLVNTGTLHVIAASGFNVMIVASVLMRVVLKFARRELAIGWGVSGIWIYVLLSGAGASVVRAGIMGSLTLIAYYFGRPAEAKRLLWVTAGVMLMAEPMMLVNVGFQLSVAATAGLLYLEPIMRSRFKIMDLRFKYLQGILANYLYPTLAATIATLPIIWWHFGRIAWISPLVNTLILPIVPLIMGMSALVLLGGQVVAWLAYVPLAYVVWVIRLWG